MKNMNFAPPIFWMLLLLTGCIGCKSIDNTVIIHYEEVATFVQYQFMPPEGTGIPTFLTEGSYVVYKINSVENQSPGAIDFNLDPTKLYVVPAPKQSLPGTTNPLSSYTMTKTHLIPKKMTVNDLGRLILIVEGDRLEIMTAQNNLQYKSDSGESVLLIRQNVQKKRLDPATPINLTAL